MGDESKLATFIDRHHHASQERRRMSVSLVMKVQPHLNRIPKADSQNLTKQHIMRRSISCDRSPCTRQRCTSEPFRRRNRSNIGHDAQMPTPAHNVAEITYPLTDWLEGAARSTPSTVPALRESDLATAQSKKSRTNICHEVGMTPWL